MVVPNIRNPNRHRTLQVATPTKSQYHLEPDHTFAYRHVGRRTKGGTGGGFLYSSGAYRSNGGNGTGNGSTVAIVFALVGVCLAFICIAFACSKSEKRRNENHGDIRTTRNSVYRQRSQRAAANNNNNNNNNATAIQFHTSQSVYNSPSGGDPIQFHTSPNVYSTPSGAVDSIPYVTGPIPERNIAMKSNFYFQIVLPDKSNIDPSVLREEAEMGDTASDEDSVIENGDPPGKGGIHKGTNNSLSSRFLMSTWRRPTASDECSICLQSYEPGQTICLAKNTNCKHVFHQDCIEEWLRDHSDCPLCRVNLVYKPP
ncbi:unnamed protein product [Cylindrotheca closterium]|uniref:RING-type domain-containing protein n=1 Tax=Cylindrotheca closterium TaxID=2856 RepID=A0AAD2CME8_9STRA|nr:unnamed protein product [Cylindrotheca closterium]